MFSFSLVLFVLANAASVLAQTAGFDVFSLPAAQSTFSVGSILPIVWAPQTTTGTVSIELIGGSSTNNLNPITVVVSSIPSQQGSYNWTIPSGVGQFATYGLNLTLDVNTNTFQYSSPFYITGGSSIPVSSSSSGSSGIFSTSTSGSASGTVPSTNSTSASLASSTTYTTVVTTGVSSLSASQSVSRSASQSASSSITTSTTVASNATVTKGTITSSLSAAASTTATSEAGVKVFSGLLSLGSVFVFALAF